MLSIEWFQRSETDLFSGDEYGRQVGADAVHHAAQQAAAEAQH